jgi:hypothetical protein
MDASPLNAGGVPMEAANKSITIDHGEILIINKCQKN